MNSFSPHLYLSILRFPPVMVGFTPGRIPVSVEGLLPGESAHQLQFAPWYPSITGWLPTYGEPVREHVTGPLGQPLYSLSLCRPTLRLTSRLQPSGRTGGPPAGWCFTGLSFRMDALSPREDAQKCFRTGNFFLKHICDFSDIFVFHLYSRLHLMDFWDVNTSRLELKPTLPGLTEDPEGTLTTCRLVWFFSPLLTF